MNAIKMLCLLGAAAAVLTAACGSSDTCSDVSGTWVSSSQVDATACGYGTYPESRTYVIAQAAGQCAIDVTTSGVSLPGTVSGTSVSWTGTYPTTFGDVTVTGGELTLGAGEATLSGTITWSYAGGSKQCTGTSEVTATKSK